eukprot:gnl/TRDRNA2_/TRDRNA2_94324_c0_seq1.p1 gnl/TRDRNA2_/TRDRNA2_94324_c0~~gnl/TRDRNA2_/TRDRNA2_94324_c0_seq1.p1  ORF type:complete len:139 (+),score=44.33 gnl/TRDRNA2_/TRDRNA2_94324_c0_seq1:92-508(+)
MCHPCDVYCAPSTQQQAKDAKKASDAAMAAKAKKTYVVNCESKVVASDGTVVLSFRTMGGKEITLEVTEAKSKEELAEMIHEQHQPDDSDVDVVIQGYDEKEFGEVTAGKVPAEVEVPAEVRVPSAPNIESECQQKSA